MLVTITKARVEHSNNGGCRTTWVRCGENLTKSLRTETLLYVLSRAAEGGRGGLTPDVLIIGLFPYYIKVKGEKQSCCCPHHEGIYWQWRYSSSLVNFKPVPF
jgi:hypothetical protein